MHGKMHGEMHREMHGEMHGVRARARLAARGAISAWLHPQGGHSRTLSLLQDPLFLPWLSQHAGGW